MASEGKRVGNCYRIFALRSYQPSNQENTKTRFWGKMVNQITADATPNFDKRSSAVRSMRTIGWDCGGMIKIGFGVHFSSNLA